MGEGVVVRPFHADLRCAGAVDDVVPRLPVGIDELLSASFPG
jgi:hypothetical protein